VSKYCDHLPLYRQESIYWSRHRVWLPRQTMAEWVELAAQWLKPIYEVIRGEVFGRGYVQIDETPIRYLAPGHGKTKHGYLWTSSDPAEDVVFDWQTSRAASCLEKIVPLDFTGVVQADGYEAYDCFARSRGVALCSLAAWLTYAASFMKRRSKRQRLPAGSCGNWAIAWAKAQQVANRAAA
jgi:hypothetical protein